MEINKGLENINFIKKGGDFAEALLHTSVAVLILIVSQALISIVSSVFGVSSTALFSSFGILQDPLQFALSLSVSLILIIVYLYSTSRMSVIHIKRPRLSILLFVIGGVAILLISNAILSQLFTLLGISIGTNTALGSGSQNPVYYLYMVPIMILFVGPVEELVFRGISQGSFREYFSVHTSVFVTSILFGLIHVSSIESQSFLEVGSYILITVVLGIVLGYAYEKTEDILVPILMHGLYNSSLLIFLYISERVDVVPFV